jgi:flotillin
MIEQLKRDVEISIILKEKEKSEAEALKLEANAIEEEAKQKIITVTEKAKAERLKEIALIEALKELEVAEHKAKATEILSKSRMKEGEAQAYVRLKEFEAENALSEKIINRDILLNLIDKAPTIISELMSPAKNIEGIKILQIDGHRPDSSQASNSIPIGIINAIISAGALIPVLKEILEFSKIDKKTIEKIAEYIPSFKSSEK